MCGLYLSFWNTVLRSQTVDRRVSHVFGCCQGGRIWPRPVVAFVVALLAASAGCSGQSSFLTGGPTVGQLKTSLSHLEYENEQLKKKTAKLERENRSMEDRLVQEQSVAHWSVQGPIKDVC